MGACAVGATIYKQFNLYISAIFFFKELVQI